MASRRLIIGLLAAAGLAGCGSTASTETPAGHTVTGTLRVVVSHSSYASPDCSALSGGFSDIAAGTQVIVKDDGGKIVGTGQLKNEGVRNSSTECEYSFSVGPVPDRPFYSVEVSHRGAQTYSLDQMKAQGWKIQLSLGS